MAYCPIPIYNIHASVGKKGDNRSTDVMLIESLVEISFRSCGDLSRGVTMLGMQLPKSLPRRTGIANEDLTTWITFVQKMCGNFVPVVDGRFDPIPSKNGFIMDAQYSSRKRWSLYYLVTTAFKASPREYLALVDILKMPRMAELDGELISI